jgi:hypothetical protein
MMREHLREIAAGDPVFWIPMYFSMFATVVIFDFVSAVIEIVPLVFY